MENYIQTFLQQFWDTIAEMSPYLLFGFLIAGILSVIISRNFVQRHLAGRGPGPVIKASIFGVPMPLCSCGVIPVATSLRSRGASKAASISFLLSTPQTGVDSIMITLSLMGPVIAIIRPVVAFITGVFGGFAVQIQEPADAGPADSKADEAKDCAGSCCEKEKQPGGIMNYLRRIFVHGFVTLPGDVGKAMLVGLVIAAVIGAFLPDDFFAEHLGDGIVSKLVMLVGGIPVYVCSAASVPIAAAMVAKGLSPGAAMVFLMTGPATNSVTFFTVWKSMGIKTAITYLVSVIICAMGTGILVDMFLPGLAGSIASHYHEMEIALFEHISAVVLLILLIYSSLPSRLRPVGN